MPFLFLSQNCNQNPISGGDEYVSTMSVKLWNTSPSLKSSLAHFFLFLQLGTFCNTVPVPGTWKIQRPFGVTPATKIYKKDYKKTKMNILSNFSHKVSKASKYWFIAFLTQKLLNFSRILCVLDLGKQGKG